MDASASQKSVVAKYLPTQVHENIKEFLKYRKLGLVSGSVSRRKTQKVITHEGSLSTDEFTKAIQMDGYVIIEAEDLPEKDRRYRKSVSEVNQKRKTKTYIIIIDMNSKYASQSPEFVILMKRIPGFDHPKREFNLDIILITQHALSSHIQKKIDLYKNFGTETAGFTNIEDYQYHVFRSNVMDPNHAFIPPHRLLSRDEENELLVKIHAEKKDLSRIHQSDPPIVWIGGEVGDIIEISQFSEATGVSLEYRVVIPPKRV
jgi:DNA-directed RNA polymerase subunit H (RpoH/RPB5)